jgi:leucyl-tRNA synthetase
VLNPVVPHVTHVLWQDLGYAAKHGDIVDAAWPQVDEGALVQDEIELVLQVNGKLRGKLMVAAGADTAAIEAAAIAWMHAQRALAKNRTGGDDGAIDVERVIVVPKRLVNIVLAKQPA